MSCQPRWEKNFFFFVDLFPFCFLNFVFPKGKVLNFYKVNFIKFFIYGSCLLYPIQQIFAYPKSAKIFLQEVM